jgi:anthranilate synthase component 2
MGKIVFLDNQDSFTYNLVDELKSLDFDVTVYRNTVSANTILETIDEIKSSGETPVLFLSPGPGKPSDSVCMMTLLEKLAGSIPIIGVCLGHQAIAEHFGAQVVLAGETVHGKSSVVDCNEHPIFEGLGPKMNVARYHSLAVKELPKNLTVIANYQHIPMAIADDEKKIIGFQFHPESILTTQGSELLRQTVRYLTK